MFIRLATEGNSYNLSLLSLFFVYFSGWIRTHCQWYASRKQISLPIIGGQRAGVWFYWSMRLPSTPTINVRILRSPTYERTLITYDGNQSFQAKMTLTYPESHKLQIDRY